MLMEKYRENPRKVREIFETVRNTDTDRAEAREYIKYLGKDIVRFTDREKNLSLASIGLVVAGAGLVMGGVKYYGDILICSGLVTSFITFFYLIDPQTVNQISENGVGDREKNYNSVRNLETKAQKIQ